MFTHEERMAAYEQLPQPVQLLYSSPSTGQKLAEILQTYHLKEGLYAQYALAFGDVVLGLEDESKLPRLLVDRAQFPEKLATIISHDLLEFINEHKVYHQQLSIEEKSESEEVIPEAPTKPKVNFSVFQKREPVREPLPQNEPPSAPAWSRFVEHHPTPAEPIHTEIPQVPSAPQTPAQESESQIPSYARPLTNTPRYQEDPYREKPE